jgi:hypothetical protein
MILRFLADEDDPWGIVRRLMRDANASRDRHLGSVACLTYAGLFGWQESDRCCAIGVGLSGARGRPLPVIPARQVVRRKLVTPAS